jgi:hypothetical protein
MVGTRLTIFIASDQPGPWVGQLWHPWEDEAIGTVCGRDGDPNTPGYDASLLPSATYHPDRSADAPSHAIVDDVYDPNGVGLYLSLGPEAIAGEWCVVDYHAKTLGTCYLGLYTADIQTDPCDLDVWFPSSLERQDWPCTLLQVLAFNHVASRDFGQDAIVNLVDFALLAGAWRSDAPDPNQFEPAPPIDPNTVLSPDLNADDTVDVADLVLFSAYWLERTDVNRPATDPNALDPLEDPPGQ